MLAACFCVVPGCLGQNYDAMDGNWLLTGEFNVSQTVAPRLTLTIGVFGENVFGEGAYGGKLCGSVFNVQGKLAADGSFTLTSSPVSITGTFDEGSSNWTGSYEVTCGGGSSGKFVARRIRSPQGNYSGILYGGIKVSLSLTPGAFTSKASPQHVDGNGSVPVVRFTPITGTLKIDGLGSTKDTELTAVADPNSRLAGEAFIMTFPIRPGSYVLVAGYMKDDQAHGLSVSATLYSQRTATETVKPVESTEGSLLRQ